MTASWRTIGLGVVTAGLLLALNAMIYQKEQLLADGQTVYLPLDTEESQVLLDGGSMILHYRIADPIARQRGPREMDGRAVVRLDARRVATYERPYGGGPLEDDEVLLGWRHRERIVVGPDAYDFKEGTSEQKADAEYAKLRVGDDGQVLVVDLVEAPDPR